MDNYQETFNTWDKVATRYQDKFMHLDLYNDTYDRFCDVVQKRDATIFEIGCGPGNITQYLYNKRPDFKISAIDVSANMIDLARKNIPSVSFSKMDCRNIYTIRSGFDGIISGFCLPYLSESDVSRLITDISSLLNLTGILYVSFVEAAIYTEGFLTGSTGDRTYFYHHTLDFVSKELKINGFEIIDAVHKNYIRDDGTQELHTIIIAIKSK